MAISAQSQINAVLKYDYVDDSTGPNNSFIHFTQGVNNSYKIQFEALIPWGLVSLHTVTLMELQLSVLLEKQHQTVSKYIKKVLFFKSLTCLHW